VEDITGVAAVTGIDVPVKLVICLGLALMRTWISTRTAPA
jgi:hypothetical protein